MNLAEIIGEYLTSHSIKSDIKTNRRYLNKKQACEYLQISNNTLDNWIKNGLPLIKLGKSIRFDQIAIDRWLETIAKTD